jgi:superfamily I DNA/RNA helicase
MAQDILRGEAFDDLDGATDDSNGYRSAFDGPPPVLERFVTPAEEGEYVATVVKKWLDAGVSPSAIGAVGRTRLTLRSTQESLTRAGILWGDLDEEGEGRVRVTTMHSAKGLEFARLVVVGVNADTLPLPIAVTPAGEDERQHAYDILRERCLLYVACTRARDELVVTGSGVPSTFLPA